MRLCTYPGCRRERRSVRYCRGHELEAEAWLKEEAWLDDVSVQGLDAVATVEEWADWDWDDLFSSKPGNFGDFSRAEPINTGAVVSRFDLNDLNNDDEPARE